MDDTAERYDRQTRMLGAAGQDEIATTNVAVVGLGGLGSHLTQQLAYLGVRTFLLIDGDVVEPSNLNRLIGATPADTEDAAPKVKVATRTISRIAPHVDFQTLADSFITETGFRLLKHADLIFGAVDNDASRMILNEFAQAYEIPYIDAATDVDDEGRRVNYGGRVVVSAGGDGCLVCRGVLDQEAINVEVADEEQLQKREEIYGVDTALLGDPGPSVVSVNGIVASLAVTEFMNLVTGIREARPHLTYRGAQGGVFFGEPPLDESCYFCDGIRGQGDDSDLERHLRSGGGG